MKSYITKMVVVGVLLSAGMNAWALGEGVSLRGIMSASHDCRSRLSYKDQLIEAVRAGSIDDVEALMTPVISADVINACHLVHLAAERGDAAILDTLLEWGGGVNTYNDQNDTPLHLAARSNHPEAMLVLLLRGADTSLRSGRGVTVEDIVRRLGLDRQDVILAFETTRAFYRNGQLLTGEMGMTLLHYVAEAGYVVAANLVLGRGANVGAQNHAQSQVMPLHLAAAEGHLAMVMLLLNYGADVNAANAHGWTPLHYAALRGHAGVVDCLIERGANMEAEGSLYRASGGYTPLHFAAMHGYADTVRTLLRHGAHYDAFTHDGQLPEVLAWDGGHDEAYDLLLDAARTGQAQGDAMAGGCDCEDSGLREEEVQVVRRGNLRANM